MLYNKTILMMGPIFKDSFKESVFLVRLRKDIYLENSPEWQKN